MGYAGQVVLPKQGSDTIVGEPSAFKIIVGWVSAGILLPMAFIHFATPLAGLTLLALLSN